MKLGHVDDGDRWLTVMQTAADPQAPDRVTTRSAASSVTRAWAVATRAPVCKTSTLPSDTSPRAAPTRQSR